jgi:hypothetical protein
MLDYSLGALIAALLPFVPAALGVSDASIWRSSSIAALLGIAGYFVIAPRSFPTTLSKELSGRRRRVAFLLGGDTLMVLLLAENAFGVFHTPSFVPYLVAVFWHLLGAIVGFSGIVTLAWEAPPE